MKNKTISTLLALLTLLPILLLTSCEKEDIYNFQTPEEAVTAFENALLKKGRYTLAKIMRLNPRNNTMSGFSEVIVSDPVFTQIYPENDIPTNNVFYEISMTITKKKYAQFDFLEEGNNNYYITIVQDDDGIWYVKKFANLKPQELKPDYQPE